MRTYFPNKESLGLIKNQDGVSEQSFEAALRIPFTFPRASLLTAKVDRAASCGPNRGPSSAPLFLVNHWVSTDPAPRPSDATRVNAYAPLLARARVCESLRHRVPNLLAVNFYKEGDVFRVVDTLNGV